MRGYNRQHAPRNNAQKFFKTLIRPLFFKGLSSCIDWGIRELSLETQTKLFVQGQIRDGCLDMVSSYILDYENSCNPFANRSASISSFLTLAKTFVGADHAQQIQEHAVQIMEAGVKEKDSLHVACAIFAKSDYFITTDYRLLKYKSDDIRIIDPIRFVLEYELRDSL